MRKSMVTLFSLLAVSVAGSASAETRFVAGDDSLETQLCVSAVTDSSIRFYVRVQESGMNMRGVSRNITCNGENIGSFTRNAGHAGNAHQLLRHDPGYVEVKEVTAAVEQSKDLRVAGNDVPKVIVVRGAR